MLPFNQDVRFRKQFACRFGHPAGSGAIADAPMKILEVIKVNARSLIYAFVLTFTS